VGYCRGRGGHPSLGQRGGRSAIERPLFLAAAIDREEDRDRGTALRRKENCWKPLVASA
jgi:hypothetical protein